MGAFALWIAGHAGAMPRALPRAPLLKRPRDFWNGVVYVALGTGAILVAREYRLGTALAMGPRYFPTILAALLVLVGLVSVARAFVGAGGGERVEPIAWRQLALVLVPIVAFGALVRGAGLAPAVFTMVVVSARASTRFRWPVALALAAGVTAFSAVVFVELLGVPVPSLGTWFGS